MLLRRRRPIAPFLVAVSPVPALAAANGGELVRTGGLTRVPHLWLDAVSYWDELRAEAPARYPGAERSGTARVVLLRFGSPDLLVGATEAPARRGGAARFA